jgi:hypothetical protein
MGGTCSCGRSDDVGKEIETSRMNDMPRSFIFQERADETHEQILNNALIHIIELDDGIDKPGTKHIPPSSEFIRELREPPLIFKEKFQKLDNMLGQFDTNQRKPDNFPTQESGWLEIIHRDPNAKLDPYNLHLQNKPSAFNLEMKHITNINSISEIPAHEMVYQFYKGNWRRKKMHGFGKLVTVEGHVYEGFFKSGKPHGSGRLVYTTGEIASGNFEKGFLNGKGRIIDNDGLTVEGMFAKNKLNDPKGRTNFKGILVKEVHPDGTTFFGSYKNGKKNGPGELIFKNGEVIKGQFVEDFLTGNGKKIFFIFSRSQIF